MPKRRRNKKNRRGRAKNSGNGESGEKSQVSLEHVPENIDDSLECRGEKSPLRTPSPHKTILHNDNSIKTTPVNRQRSNRDRKSMYDSFNVTNLNILFDSNFIINGTKSGSDVCMNKNDISLMKRSHSSIPKLHSPVKEKPFRINQGTQTNTYFEPFLKTCNEIIETPKISRVYLLQETPGEKSFPIFKSKLLSDANNSRRSSIYRNEVNINPYLKKENNLMRREGSYGDSSFFSPLPEVRSSSTPIEKFGKAVDAVEHLVDCSFSVGKLNNVGSPMTPKHESNLNLNVPVSDKVINKEDSMRSLRMHTFNVSKRKSLRSLPKSPTSRKNNSKVCNRSRQFSYSILDISQRSLLDLTTTNNLNRPGACQRVFLRLKKYCQTPRHWPAKVYDMCTQLGIQLKNSLSSLCNNVDNSAIECRERSSCRCEEYRQEIGNLNAKINELSDDMRTVKGQIERGADFKSDIDTLNQELKTIKEELKQFKDIRSELESVKNRISCMKAGYSATPLSVPPPPPVAPPPPPPPPPPPCLSPLASTKIKVTRKTNAATAGKENFRPVISLDDILKVKLRKSTDRGFQTPATRRGTQPVVSMEMLRQVKLRPASRGSVNSVTPECTSSTSDLPTSPHSSLCRRNMLAKRDRSDS